MSVAQQNSRILRAKESEWSMLYLMDSYRLKTSEESLVALCSSLNSKIKFTPSTTKDDNLFKCLQFAFAQDVKIQRELVNALYAKFYDSLHEDERIHYKLHREMESYNYDWNLFFKHIHEWTLHQLQKEELDRMNFMAAEYAKYLQTLQARTQFLNPVDCNDCRDD